MLPALIEDQNAYILDLTVLCSPACSSIGACLLTNQWKLQHWFVRYVRLRPPQKKNKKNAILKPLSCSSINSVPFSSRPMVSRHRERSGCTERTRSRRPIIKNFVTIVKQKSHDRSWLDNRITEYLLFDKIELMIYTDSRSAHE